MALPIFAIVAALFGITGILFIRVDHRIAVVAMALVLAGLIPLFQDAAGIPAGADQRLSTEPWRLLSVAPLAENRFLIGVRYASGALRSYDLNLADPGQRDTFLKAAGALKKGRVINGHAKHGRAGLLNDGDMDFGFSDAPESEPKHSSEG